MSETPDKPETRPERSGTSPAKAKRTLRDRLHWFKPHTPLQWLCELALLLLLTAGVLLVVVRFVPLTSEIRLFIQARVQGIEVGPYGKLRIDGLQGDLWSDFRIRRLTIADAKGVWIEADDLHVQWRYAELLRSRLHVTEIDAARLQVTRQPTPKPNNKPPGKAPPFSFAIDRIKTRVELAPAFSVAKGVYDLDGAFSMQDRGTTVVHADARSVLHKGDFLKLALALGKDKAVKLDVDAREANGGALAGMLGYPADLPFDLTAHVGGTLTNGKVAAQVRSGEVTAMTANGAWNPKGGGVSGHLVMAANKWTRPLVKGFGPEAQLAIIAKQHPDAEAGKKASGKLWDTDVRFITSNIVIMGRGPFDTGKGSSGGLATSIVVKDLHQLSPEPQMGPGHATGMLSGSLADMRFAGDLEARDLELLGWKLQRASGSTKVHWAKGELEVQGDLTGFGGSGAGVIAEFGGQQPKATVDVMRLKDGRILIKTLNATGHGLKLQASGGQNPLFKGLSFKGDMQITDLAQVLPGSSGGVNASWSASQDAGVNMPWVFSAEGRGQKMATGTGEIDRLTGPDPQLTLRASLQDGVFNIAQASLAGAKEHANAQGRWALAGGLDLLLDWEAEGPFGFGPLEVDGKAAGAGRIGGTLGAPKIELMASFGAIKFPQMTLKQAKLDLTLAQGKDGSDGTIALTGQSDYGAARARSDFRFLSGGIDLTGIDADAGGIKAKGGLSLRDGSPSSAELAVDIGPGVLLTEGQAKGAIKVTEADKSAGGARADVDLTAKGAVLRIQPLALANAHVTANGPLSRLPYKISGDGAYLRTPVKLDGSGVLTKDPKGLSIAFSGAGNLRRAPFKTLEPIDVRLDEGDVATKMRLSLGGGRAEIDGRMTGGGVTLKAALSSVDLSFLSEDFTGGLDAHVQLQGQGPELHGGFDMVLKNAKSRDARKGLSIDGEIKGQLQQGRLTIDAKLGSEQGLSSTANVVLPAEASASPFKLGLVREKPMQGAFEADGDIRPLWDLFLGGERTLGGKLMAKASIGGTLADPKVTGRVDLTEGLFEDYATGLKLRSVTLGATLNTDTVSLDKFQGVDTGKGQVSGSGQMSLARGGDSSLTLNLAGFRLIDNDTAQADATGQVALTRSADGKAKIAGALQIVKGEVNAAARTGPNIVAMDVIEKNRPFRIDEQIDAPPPGNQQNQGQIALDVTLKAPRGILIKGRGLDLDMSMDARVTGTTLKPVLDGEARIVRGDYDFSGKRFEFDNRGTVHLSTDPGAIRLDLTATRQDSSFTAVIRIQGTASKPQITLTSNPVLPNDEVLSQVLFGSSAAQLSPLEAAQLASALSALASGGGFDVIGNLRSFARIDRLAVSGGGQAGVSAAVGKYLTDNIYLEVGGNKAGATAQLEYRVTHNLSLVSKLNDQIVTQTGTVIQGGDELSVRWRHDFKDKKSKRATAPPSQPNVPKP